MSKYDMMPKGIVKRNKEQAKALRFMLGELDTELEKQGFYSSVDGDWKQYNDVYGVTRPCKSDVVKLCDTMRKLLMDIKKVYR